MTLAFFILSALDLLGILDTQVNAAERQGYIDWIYHCQHPQGGFRGFTGGDLGFRDEAGQEDEGKTRTESRRNQWDAANIAGTYFALVNLILLGDDLDRLDAGACWRWLKGLQVADGSFGEVVSFEGEILSYGDIRFCYCAMGIRWILHRLLGNESHKEEMEMDVDVTGVVRFIEASQVCDDILPALLLPVDMANM